MNIDIKVLVFRPTIMTASAPLPIFVPHAQPVQLPAPLRKLGLLSLCRAIFAAAFWYLAVVALVKLI